MLQRCKLEAAAEDGHRLLKLLDRRQRRGDADVAVKRVVSIRIGRARARHHDARLLGERQRTLALAKEAGVVMTSAGATYPYGHDPLDSNIRVAPSLPPVEELEQAMAVFCCCLKLAALEQVYKF